MITLTILTFIFIIGIIGIMILTTASELVFYFMIDVGFVVIVAMLIKKLISSKKK